MSYGIHKARAKTEPPTREQQIQRLPVWAREERAEHLRDIEALRHTVSEIDRENERLRLALGERAEQEGPADTFHVNEDTGVKLPLGVGPTVNFGRKFDVRFEAGGLLIESEGVMAIMPDYNQSIFITIVEES